MSGVILLHQNEEKEALMNNTADIDLPFIWKDALLEFLIIGPMAGALYLVLGGSTSAFAITLPAAVLILAWGLATRRYHYLPGEEDEEPAVREATVQRTPPPTFTEPTTTASAEPEQTVQAKVAPPAPELPALNKADKQALVSEVLGDPCPYCGTTMNANNARLDFMDPLSRGGREEARNVSVCCATCEAKKSGRSFADWLNSLEEPFLTIAWDLYQSRKHGE
jgi:hypothetical protein